MNKEEIAAENMRRVLAAREVEMAAWARFRENKNRVPYSGGSLTCNPPLRTCAGCGSSCRFPIRDIMCVECRERHAARLEAAQTCEEAVRVDNRKKPPHGTPSAPRSPHAFPVI